MSKTTPDLYSSNTYEKEFRSFAVRKCSGGYIVEAQYIVDLPKDPVPGVDYDVFQEKPSTKTWRPKEVVFAQKDEVVAFIANYLAMPSGELHLKRANEEA